MAYKQNDRWLTPDHGFPVRMIIPGHIGGRMVKWLTVRPPCFSTSSGSISLQFLLQTLVSGLSPCWRRQRLTRLLEQL